MRVAIGIPARFASTRFPGKPLANIAGKPMIAHTIARALAANLGPVIVATDDARIATAADQAGARVCMTLSKHASGSERLAEAMRDVECDIVVNVQGDEPLIEAQAIRSVIEPFRQHPDIPMATLAHPLRHADDLQDPNIVKVICDRRGFALYFSRAPIPYARQCQGISPVPSIAMQHVGLYAYRKDFLLGYAALPACEMERIEQLEQLRVLYHGHTIAVNSGDFHCVGVDTPEDIPKVERLLAQ